MNLNILSLSISWKRIIIVSYARRDGILTFVRLKQTLFWPFLSFWLGSLCVLVLLVGCRFSDQNKAHSAVSKAWPLNTSKVNLSLCRELWLWKEEQLNHSKAERGRPNHTNTQETENGGINVQWDKNRWPGTHSCMHRRSHTYKCDTWLRCILSHHRYSWSYPMSVYTGRRVHSDLAYTWGERHMLL